MQTKILLVVEVVVIATFISLTSTKMFTSSLKVKRMVEEEYRLLDEMKRFIDLQYQRLKNMSNFYIDRIRDLNSGDGPSLDLNHPNAAFNAIKRFWRGYSTALGEQLETFRAAAEDSAQVYVADNNDIKGATLSLLRLQLVYKLRALDMANGNYSGHQGPQLQYEDAYQIARIALSAGKINETLEWVNTSIVMYTNVNTSGVKVPGPNLAAMKALLGRAYLISGNRNLAQELYEEVSQLDPNNQEVIRLKLDFQDNQPPKIEPPEVRSFFQNFSRLCNMEDRYDPQVPVSPLAVCRYRQAVLPYYRFQEEILSISPFATLIYNVISDAEGEHIKGFVKDNLKRAEVGATNVKGSDVRTGDVAWIADGESETIESITRRIEGITGLEIKENLPDGPSSAESFQVVNYGLAGHYDVHIDPLRVVANDNYLSKELQNAGDRMVTFLIYLNDVVKGGATVFIQAGISVTPVKNMALMWYNFNPALKLDKRTLHAGCPVLIGQKWSGCNIFEHESLTYVTSHKQIYLLGCMTEY